nr:MAG TPA: hypothetical protein [Caudoviricetes sp.]
MLPKWNEQVSFWNGLNLQTKLISGTRSRPTRMSACQ